MVTSGTGPIQKTTRGFQVRLPFLPQAKRRGRVKPYLYVGLIRVMYVNSARVFPAITPESITDILHFILIPAMATGTKCRVFRPGENAAANQREGIGRKNGEDNTGGHTEFSRVSDQRHKLTSKISPG